MGTHVHAYHFITSSLNHRITFFAEPALNDPILDPLNPEQREAVTATDQEVLVLAGAGSGKTRVIAHRVAWLLQEHHLSPHSLLAVTFTNKAAAEMQERVLRLLGKESLPFLWVGTFHSVCARILRADVESLGGPYSGRFTITDAEDALGLIRHILRDRGISEGNFQPRAVQSAISRAKAGSIGAEAYAEKARTFAQRTIAPVYLDYEKRLLESNSMDFDDLLYLTETLLREREEVRDKYRKRFLHVLVDEYQDTNRTQYRLLNLLAGPLTRLFTVGDEDQSVYRWRGADIHNILDFQRDFPKARVIKLERNYRSTKPILEAANVLVAHNENRLGKNLWTNREGGNEVQVYAAPSDREEASFVADSLRGLHSSYAYRQMAVLYRTNAQSRPFEEALLNRGIPYQVIGGLRFYERKEVKDILAYLRLAANPLDRISLMRVLNVPPRGIGKTTVLALESSAQEHGTTLMQAIRDEAAGKGELSARARISLEGFLEIFDAVSKRVRAPGLAEMAEFAMQITGYVEYLASQKGPGPDPQDRVDNLRELVSAMREFEVREGGDLLAFLERQALASDQDELEGQDSVKVLTLHSAKGLEFPVVFLAGLEEDFLPHALSTESQEEVEEERRLCYVGMTRAMDRLTLSWARQRYVFGSLQDRSPSPFLREIPSDLLKSVGGVASAPKNLLQAAALFSQAVESPRRAEFRIGNRVHHPKFGFGIVLSSEGEGEEAKVTVSFNRFGRKKLLAKMARLEPV